MGVSLQKGGNVSLEKVAPGMTKMLLGLGWDSRASDGTDFDLDASVFMVGADGKVRVDGDFIFYNNLKSACGSVKVDLTLIPADVNKVIVGVTIHEADTRNQNFGQVSNAFIRVVNQDSNEEVARYDLSEDYSIETALVFGELYRHNNEWKFKAIGQGFAGGLKPMAQQYGVNVG